MVDGRDGEPAKACACAVYDDDPGMVVCWRCGELVVVLA